MEKTNKSVMEKYIIAIDFDGTMVQHRYPEVGTELPQAADTIRELCDLGHQIILWTMRSGPELEDAVNWCSDRGISLYGVNMNPTQSTWTTSPKAYAQIYIDDAALGTPLLWDGLRPCVDWSQIREMLKKLNAL